jgi:hypothetical protein
VRWKSGFSTSGGRVRPLAFALAMMPGSTALPRLLIVLSALSQSIWVGGTGRATGDAHSCGDRGASREKT